MQTRDTVLAEPGPRAVKENPLLVLEQSPGYGTPWHRGTEADGEDLIGLVLTRGKKIVVDPLGSETIPESAFMDRIIACVNACQGLSNAELGELPAGQLAVLYLDDRAKRVQAEAGL